jgi:hypothetical protein
MLRLIIALRSSYKLILLCGVAALFTVVGLLHYQVVSAALVKPRSVKLDNPAINATNVIYEVELGVTTPGTLGSVKVLFCSNTSILIDPCDPPNGLDVGNAVLDNESGISGFSVHASSTANQLVLSRTPAFTSIATGRYTFSGITNPADVGTIFVRIFTYPTNDASGGYNDGGGLAFTTNDDVNLSAEVPPYLLFCTGVRIAGFNCASSEGDFIDFGGLSPIRTSAGNSQMVAATNGAGGYSIRVSGSDFASGSNVIAPMVNEPSVIGRSQFGMNLRANLRPETGNDAIGPGAGQIEPAYNVPDRYRFSSGEVVASSPIVDDYRKYTASYVVNVPKDQPGGVYAATMTYICLANF